MRRIGMPLALFLVLAANGLVLLGVYWNRSGDPDAVVELTERELWAARAGKENTGISLSLRWAVQGYWKEEPGWFDHDKLEEIGFDCRYPLEDPQAGDRYRKLLPRDTFAVLEFDGDAWKEWIAQQEAELADLEAKVDQGEATGEQLERQRDTVETQKATSSRLFVVDVGNAPRLLRERYPDRARYIVTPALVRVRTVNRYNEETDVYEVAGLRGAIGRILVGEIHVPRSLRYDLERILEEDERSGRTGYRHREGEPRFTAVLAYGRRYEPTLTAIRTIAPE